jgi:hypothetical protein
MTLPAAWVLLFASLVSAAGCFAGIVRRYRTLLGFPWLLSLALAASSLLGIFALYTLLHL